MPQPLLLASGSPRRREILAQLGVPIVVRAVNADETVLAGEAARTYLERIVGVKLSAAFDVPEAREVTTVLVADTSVIVDGDILGKPVDADEAAAMIGRLAGRSHEVWTRFAIGDAASRAVLHAETVETVVTFRALSAARVRAYAESGEGLDKAGGYAVQGLGAGIVSRIEGSYTNVVGLPACEVAQALERLGLVP